MNIIKLISRIFKRGPKGPSPEERNLPASYVPGIERRHDGLINDLGSAGLSDRQIRETLEAIEYYLEGPLMDLGECADIALGWTSLKVTHQRKIELDHVISQLYESFERLSVAAASLYEREKMNESL